MIIFEKITDGLSGAMNRIAGWAVVGMMALTCVDVVLRELRMPYPFMRDLVALLSGVAISFALAHTTAVKGHVAVSIILDRLSTRKQNIIDAVTSFLGLFLFSMATWRLFVKAEDLREYGQTAMSSEIPLYPFAYGMALSTSVVCLVLLGAFIKNFRKAL